MKLCFHEESFILAEKTQSAGIANSLTGDTLVAIIKNTQMSFELGLEKRERILKVSLLIENMSSAFLSRLMGIENYKDTISFGNKSTSLSFNQKINLLIDIGALPYEQRANLLRLWKFVINLCIILKQKLMKVVSALYQEKINSF